MCFWISVGLIVYAQLGYPLLLAAAARLVRERADGPNGGSPPRTSLIIAAHDESAVIAAKIANVRALRWPDQHLEVVVCSDGSGDDTVARAREAGADIVLELPRMGKIAAQDAGVAASHGELLAFSDANAMWEPDALEALAGAFADPRVHYACGQMRFVGAPGGDNQEGLYWRYEMAIQAAESRLRSVTSGNGGIYAVRRESYMVLGELMDHDLSFPFSMVKRGRSAVYVPAARASEKMVPSLRGEFARKRRMMGYIWAITLRGGMLSPRGYGLRYGWMILSHRVLRYAVPALHLAALGTNVALVANGHGALYDACLAAQLALLAAAAAGRRLRWRPLLVARYYVLMQAAAAAGLWDYLRHGKEPGWETPEGTR